MTGTSRFVHWLPISVTAPIIMSTVLAGLSAGFFFAYSANVVLALGAVSGPTYTSVMQPINESVRNPAFVAVFFGPVVVSAIGITTILLRRELFTRYGLLFLAGAVVYLVGTVAVTTTVHVPINEYIETWSAAAPPADWVAVRARWTRWNLVRTVAASVSFVLYLATTVTVICHLAGEVNE